MFSKLAYKLDFLTRNVRLKRKLLIILLLVSLLPLLSTAAYFHYLTKATLEDAIGNNMIEITDQIIRDHDVFFEEIDRITSIIHFNSDVQFFLSIGKKPESDTDLAVIASVRKLLMSVANMPNYFRGAVLVNDQGRYVHYSLESVKDWKYRFRDDPWYRDITKYNQLKLSNAHPQTYFNGKEAVTYSKRLMQFSDLEESGTLIIDFAPSFITQWSDSIQLGQTGFSFVLTETGETVTTPPAYSESFWKEQWMSRMQGRSSGYYQLRTDRTNYLVSFSTSIITGWKSVAVAPYNEITEDIRDIRSAMLLIMFLAVAVIFVIASYVSRAISNPLRRLERQMRVVETGDLDVRFPWRRADEFGSVGNSFNRMLDQLKILRQEVYLSKIQHYRLELMRKNAEMEALQSQINPHFLYNSLNTMNCIGEVHEVEEISVISRSLATMFKYSIDGEKISTLGKELSHVKAFLNVIQIRFPGRIDCRIDIPEPSMDIKVLKLILQPIVENAVLHGLIPEGGGVLRICSCVTKDTLRIQVKDNGRGIGERELAALNLALQSGAAGDESIDYGGHIGLKNVQQRLRLYYGERGMLRLKASKHKGIIVELQLPLDGRTEHA